MLPSLSAPAITNVSFLGSTSKCTIPVLVNFTTFSSSKLSFDSEEQEVETSAPEVAPEEEVDKKGFFEFDTGDFKIKIRSPKNKKDTDVSR